MLNDAPINDIMKRTGVSFSRLLIGMTFLLILTGISESCSKSVTDMSKQNDGSGSNTQGSNEVVIQGMAFSPNSIKVAAGTTVTWTNKDAIAHTVTSNSGLFDSGSISSNGTFSHQFSSPGTYPYFCSVHTMMTGTVTVN